MTNKRILVEGWRGINHSYAMVNQFQLLEMVALGVDVSHLDLPFYNPKWSASNNDSGFDDATKKRINLIKSAIPGHKYDVTYRISFPYRLYEAKSKKVFVFATSELQFLDENYFYNGYIDKSRAIKDENLKIITPSQWSKIGFLNSEFSESNILVIPHGINPSIYKPVHPQRRKLFRDALGIRDDEFLILSVGGMFHNKGIDLLVIAFAELKQKYDNIRLVLKDSSGLYGFGARDLLSHLYKTNLRLKPDALLSSITVLSDNLNLAQLNGLYGAADCYVSPYRAEGFNLTPLEAVASGTPIVVTKGGSTDDYFHESFGLQIEGRAVEKDGRHSIEPSLDSLMHQISMLIDRKAIKLDNVAAQAYINNNFTWECAAKKLVKYL